MDRLSPRSLQLNLMCSLTVWGLFYGDILWLESDNVLFSLIPLVAAVLAYFAIYALQDLMKMHNTKNRPKAMIVWYSYLITGVGMMIVAACLQEVVMSQYSFSLIVSSPYLSIGCYLVWIYWQTAKRVDNNN